MQTLDRFDVLVVYSQAIARSASNLDITQTSPFSPTSRRANYNDAYSYFLKTCQDNGLSAAFTTSEDIIGAGKCKSYWVFKKNAWIKTNRICSSKLIFDKFSPVNDDRKDKRQLLFSSSRIKIFNNKYLFQLFFDKYKTYRKLKSFSIPTIAINNSNIEKSLKTLKNTIKRNSYKYDFTQDFVIKDRFGAGGNNIYKVGANQQQEIKRILSAHKSISFIIQPFLKFDKGIEFGEISGLIDIRIIYNNGKIIQSYIRTAKEKDFRCNEHQGGKLVYISKKEIPTKVLKLSSRVVKNLNKKQSLFALDFIVTNKNNVYLLEGNTGPGIDWNLSEKVNEKRAKLFIRTIVKSLTQTVYESRQRRGSLKAAKSKIILSRPAAIDINQLQAGY